MSVNKKKSEQELANDKAERIMDGVAAWASFYRDNPQRFAKDYLNVTLKLFQKILLYAMMHNYHFIFWAARSLGKTWLTALFCVIRCILFPKSKICVSSSTRSQANEVLQKITDDFCKNYTWGSELLCREISYSSIGQNKAVIEFRNGSWIKVVTASDSGRGNRANVIILDEFRMLDKNTLDTVMKRFNGAPRHPEYLNLKEYRNREDLLETNMEIYMSSCWYKEHWSFIKSKAYVVNMLGDRTGYFICGIPYQMAIKEGLKKRVEIEDEMSEMDFDQVKFDMEMGCLPYGSSDEAFFRFDDISQCRKLQTVVYPLSLHNKHLKIPELVQNERRILSVDIALMASKKHKNDAASIIINSALPSANNSYMSNIIYLETHEGMLTNELALLVRRLFEQYHCTDLVIDALGVGSGVYDLLTQDMVDTETGALYHALSCCNNENMAERCKVANAPKVIWAIKASASFNDEICRVLRNGFKTGKINLLVSEFECEEFLKDRIKNFSSLTSEQQMDYKMPYVETTLLVHELINLDHERKGTNIKIIEKSGARKDRYSSLAYNYWVQCQLELKELRKPQNNITMYDFAKLLGKLNKKPTTY